MAYFPSSSDIPQDSQGYTPTMADIPQDAQPSATSSLLSSMVNSAPTQFVLGAGDALRQLPIDIGNLANRGINALTGSNLAQMNNPQMGNGTAYNVGNIAGNFGSFAAGGEGLDALRAAQEGVPMIGGIARYLGQNGLGGIARRVLGSSAFGAVSNPNDPGIGAAEGAGLGAAGEALPIAAKGIGMGIDALNPSKISDSILQNINQAGGIEENGKNLAQSIRNSYLNMRQQASALYKPIQDRVGNNSIYDGGTPVTDQTGNSYNYDLTPQSQYKNLPQNIKNSYSPDLQGLHDEFSANPTFQNAHALQQQLGAEQSAWQDYGSKNGLKPTERTQMDNLGTARRAVRQDIGNYLSANHPDLSGDPDQPNSYQNASDFYLHNVVPYTQNSQINGMAKGDITNPRNISTIFKNPEPSVSKVVQDLGPQTQNQILYSSLGKIQPGAKPEKVLTALQGLDNQGMGSYVSPQIQAQKEALANSIGYRNSAQVVGSMGAGGILSHKVGGGAIADVISGALSGGILPYAMRTVARGVAPLVKPTTAAASAAYPILAKSIISNLLTRAGNQNGS